MIVAAPTRLEARAARRALPGVAVVRLGVGGSGVPLSAGPVVVVGLCGALVPLAPGTVVVPDEVATPDGPVLRCDEGLVEALRAAAERLGFDAVGGRQLTAPRIVTGGERGRWAAAGFETVDMEAALVLARCGAGAVVRVVLDTPEREISADWSVPGVLWPGRWAELVRLARIAPAYARRAAEVAAAALG